jgi:hypothetical protein
MLHKTRNQSLQTLSHEGAGSGVYPDVAVFWDIPAAIHWRSVGTSPSSPPHFILGTSHTVPRAFDSCNNRRFEIKFRFHHQGERISELGTTLAIPSSKQRMKFLQTNTDIHLSFINITNVYKLLVGKPEGNRPLGRTRRRWISNIKMDFLEVGLSVVNWIGLTQDR